MGLTERPSKDGNGLKAAIQATAKNNKPPGFHTGVIVGGLPRPVSKPDLHPVFALQLFTGELAGMATGFQRRHCGAFETFKSAVYSCTNKFRNQT